MSPLAPNRPCTKPMCKEYAVKGSKCLKHYKEKHANYNEHGRNKEYQKLYDGRWQQCRRTYLRQHPICVECNKPAWIVDHIKPHKGDYRSFWDESNWQSMCESCHNAKTAKETFHTPGMGKSL